MKEKIISLVEEILKVTAGTITETTKMEDVEQWDSLAQVMIIGELEVRFGISIPLLEAVAITSMKELLEKSGALD